MIEIEGKFLRQYKGLPYAARVTIQFEPKPSQPYILIQCSGKGGGSQGIIDDVSEHGYRDWKAGAKVGVEYALEEANANKSGVIVTKIIGLLTDTNPTIIAAAAAFAVWEAIGFKASQEELKKLEDIVFNSWNIPFNSIPTF